MELYGTDPNLRAEPTQDADKEKKLEYRDKHGFPCINVCQVSGPRAAKDSRWRSSFDLDVSEVTSWLLYNCRREV